MQTYSIVIVTHISDLKLVKHHIPIIYRFLEPKDIIIISGKNAEHEIKRMELNYVKFMDEDQIIPSLNFRSVEDIIRKRCSHTVRTGWYFQQFLKMAYANICEDEWYLLWDADTVPLRNIAFFNEKQQGILDIKSEYHRPYFRTMKKLLNIDKKIQGSFISEHMLINKNVMIDLMTKIENNDAIQGTTFFEKIINMISIMDLKKNGFSEYETYGNFAVSNYQGIYTARKLKTLREGKYLLGDHINPKLIKWASNSYDVVSFEKYHKVNPFFWICANSFLRYFISMKTMWLIYKKVYVGKYYE